VTRRTVSLDAVTKENAMITYDNPVPQPPRLRPTFTTWMYVAFMLAVVVFTLIGLWPSAVR
jgi:hypothetical protein